MPLIHPFMTVVGLAALVFAAGYAILNVIAILVWRARTPTVPPDLRPPVTLLKPLCGSEPGLYEHLRSFCRQNYGEYQIVFGVRDRSDPARHVVERLQAEFPDLPMQMVVNSKLHGSNYKVSNLINMIPYARHDILVMADSDAFVRPDYLASVTAPLVDPQVGLVTCVYHGIPTETIWSRLGAMYINEWYMPSILLSWMFGYQGYVSGQTMCLRRATLDAIGGLKIIADDLADDFRLGELIRDLGLNTYLSSYLVEGEHHEPEMESLTSHEVRWMSTIRVLRPRSFRGMFLTFIMPLATVGLVLALAGAWDKPVAGGLFVTAVIARLAMHFMHRLRGHRPMFADLWLVPVRDLLTCGVWGRSFFTSRVTWRGGEFHVNPDGVMRRLS
ncbi:MAG: ceramide glucosyltransferase [Gammaproteobacteria bacterium]|nr:ceramide glucosyltransferase [Gammaproteobacteria bacterium]